MKTCNKYSKWLTLYVLGELTEKEKTEYDVEVYALQGDGTLISKFGKNFEGGNFNLSEGNILVEEKIEELFGGLSEEDPEEFEKRMKILETDRDRLDSVYVLIDDNMIDEAQSLVNLVNSEYARGKKEVLIGYIYALRNECDKSKEMFDMAVNIDPNVCIPESYRVDCDR